MSGKSVYQAARAAVACPGSNRAGHRVICPAGYVACTECNYIGPANAATCNVPVHDTCEPHDAPRHPK
jgi:hypothetical protein